MEFCEQFLKLHSKYYQKKILYSFKGFLNEFVDQMKMTKNRKNETFETLGNKNMRFRFNFLSDS